MAGNSGTAPASTSSHAPKLTSKQLRQIENQNTAKYYAAGMVGIMALFIIYHWSRFLLRRTTSKEKQTYLQHLASRLRPLRRFLLKQVYPFNTTAQGFATFAFFAINLCVFFTRLDLTNITNVSKRLGWMAMINLCFTIFLALKNTPLAVLAGLSHESLNVVHRWAGRTTVICMILHSTVYINAWHQSGSLHELTEFTNVSGISAGFFLLAIFFSSLSIIRKRYYEFFYITHIIMVTLILIFAANHRPNFSQNAVIIPIFAACMWLSDRTARALKLVWNFYGNKATLTPLPNGATRVTLARRMRADPGSHIFLWIPAVRSFETHPFTLVSSDPVTLVASSREGFTRDLHAYASKHPGKQLRATVDGPYGAVPDFGAMDRLMLIAGGTGATFTFGVAIDIVRRLNGSKSAPSAIDFVWIFREQESLQWFAPELRTLMDSGRINLTIHATRYMGSSSTSSDDYVPNEKQIPVDPIPQSSLRNDEISQSSSEHGKFEQSAPVDIEKGPDYHENSGGSVSSSSASSRSDDFPLKPGRASISDEVRRFIESGSSAERVGIAVCGPDGLTREARKAVLECMKRDGPSITFHAEQFGW